MANFPAHEHETLPWRQAQRAGTKEDRMLTEVTVSLPPLLNPLRDELNALDSEEIRETEHAIVETDARYGYALAALNTFLIRTESVASSKIEQLDASAEEYARALAGSKANSSATAMVAAGEAVEKLVASAGESNSIREADILAAQKTLIGDDSQDARYAGNWRPMQNWIGGSDHSPRNALYVPPPPATVLHYMNDLIEFANRTDLSPLIQATVVHAQFESIHPFTDGNGRIGRALINAVLRKRGVTKQIIVPLASAIVANTDRYFDDLGRYRDGDPSALLRSFTVGSRVATIETRVTAERLSALPAQWQELIPTRKESIAHKLVSNLLATPTVDSKSVENRYSAAPKVALDGIATLEEAGVLKEITGRQRGRQWVAAEVMAELEDLNYRIGLHVNP